MRVVVQRVSRATVHVEGEKIASIDQGILALVAFSLSDTTETIQWMVRKLIQLRIFEDQQGKMNDSLLDIQGDALLVSQFTLYGDCRKGNRPNYMGAASPEQAENLYESFVQAFRKSYPHKVEVGRFRAMMDVELVNDGPVTLTLEK